jgi:2-iminobutanoate/2-iminopropanoate deaminase
MSKTIISTPNAPTAVGPYSQATHANGFIFVSGQVGIDPATKTMVEGGVKAQAQQVLTNLTAILESQGKTLEHVVKCTVFLQNMGDFATMNEVYATFFTANHPARSTVEVAKLPLGALVEIEAIAIE